MRGASSDNSDLEEIKVSLNNVRGRYENAPYARRARRRSQPRPKPGPSGLKEHLLDLPLGSDREEGPDPEELGEDEDSGHESWTKGGAFRPASKPPHRLTTSHCRLG